MAEHSAKPAGADLVRALREEVRRLESLRQPEDQRPLSSGSPDLDRVLPAGGFRRGSLVEWLATEPGSGTSTLALLAAREAARDGGAVVVMDRRRRFYPPAAAAWGLDLENLVVVRAAGRKEEMWALDQVLRCSAVAAVWARVEQLDERGFRRLQLAAEQGGGVGLLIRPARVRSQPSWADVRLLVHPLPGSTDARGQRLSVHLLRCRGGAAAPRVELELDDQTAVARRLPTAVSPRGTNVERL